MRKLIILCLWLLKCVICSIIIHSDFEGEVQCRGHHSDDESSAVLPEKISRHALKLREECLLNNNVEGFLEIGHEDSDENVILMMLPISFIKITSDPFMSLPQSFIKLHQDKELRFRFSCHHNIISSFLPGLFSLYYLNRHDSSFILFHLKPQTERNIMWWKSQLTYMKEDDIDSMKSSFGVLFSIVESMNGVQAFRFVYEFAVRHYVAAHEILFSGTRHYLYGPDTFSLLESLVDARKIYFPTQSDLNLLFTESKSFRKAISKFSVQMLRTQSYSGHLKSLIIENDFLELDYTDYIALLRLELTLPYHLNGDYVAGVRLFETILRKLPKDLYTDWAPIVWQHLRPFIDKIGGHTSGNSMAHYRLLVFYQACPQCWSFESMFFERTSVELWSRAFSESIENQNNGIFSPDSTTWIISFVDILHVLDGRADEGIVERLNDEVKKAKKSWIHDFLSAFDFYLWIYRGNQPDHITYENANHNLIKVLERAVIKAMTGRKAYCGQLEYLASTTYNNILSLLAHNSGPLLIGNDCRPRRLVDLIEQIIEDPLIFAIHLRHFGPLIVKERSEGKFSFHGVQYSEMRTRNAATQIMIFRILLDIYYDNQINLLSNPNDLSVIKIPDRLLRVGMLNTLYTLQTTLHMIYGLPMATINYTIRSHEPLLELWDADQLLGKREVKLAILQKAWNQIVKIYYPLMDPVRLEIINHSWKG